MACFNRFYSGTQHVDAHSKVSINPADARPCARATRWLKWVVQLPVQIPHLLHTIALMIRNQELILPVKKQMLPDHVVHRMPAPSLENLMRSQHWVTSPEIMEKIFGSHYRNDLAGHYAFTLSGDNVRVFLPLLRDIFQEPVTMEDFLLTCQAPQAEKYRSVIQAFLDPKNLPKLREELNDVIASALAHLREQEHEAGIVHCSAKKLARTFTVAVISNLLLGNKAAKFDDYYSISQAIETCIQYAMMQFVSMKPTPKQQTDYHNAIRVLREAIQQSSGPFSESLQGTDLTDVQRKGILFLMYFAGGDTSSSVLEYLFWQLGQHPEYQQGVPVEQLVHESLRLNPPAMMGRIPRVDLEMRVANQDGSSWGYLFPKGETVIACPYFAGRSSKWGENPDLFNPHRTEGEATSSFPWLPFGRGKHGCLGKGLALEEMKAFTKALLEEYKIKSTPEKEPRQKQLITIAFDPEVSLQLTRRV